MSACSKVSIIILNFNSFQDTIECVKSIEKIDYVNYEVIIIDNNSKDGSYETLRRHFPQHILIKSDMNLGYANGNNIGIKYALDNNADYICVLNNDVEVESDFLTFIIEKMERDDEIGIAGPCICEYYDKDTIQAMGANINLFTGLAQAKYKGYSYGNMKKEAIEVDYLGGACFVARARVIKKIGAIPENYFLFFEETEFCLRAKQNGFKLLCLRDSRVYHKRSATISKYSGLSYYFLNRNRIIFMRRNARLAHIAVFALYIVLEAIGRILIRKEPIKLFKYFLEGLTADKDNIDTYKISEYVEV
jgi:GT2 family glycosyltransferase